MPSTGEESLARTIVRLTDAGYKMLLRLISAIRSGRLRWTRGQEALETAVLECHPGAEAETDPRPGTRAPDLSPRELACRYTDAERYFASKSGVYRILKDADLITSPAYVLMSASEAFENPTTRVHEMWQTDFTCFLVVNWGWYYLSTVLDDISRYIVSWELNSAMGATT